MSKKPLAALPISADIEGDDAAIERYAKKAGIPTLKAPAQPAVSTDDTKEIAFNTTLPRHVVTAMRVGAATGKGPIRYQILKALHDSGAVEIAEADLVVQDRRGRKAEAS